MNSVQAQTHELLTYACGVMFCVGLWAILMGQVLQAELDAPDVALLATLMVASVLLAWQSIRGLVATLKKLSNGTLRQQ